MWLSVPVPRPGNLAVLRSVLTPGRGHGGAINGMLLARGTALDGAAVGGGHVSVYSVRSGSLVWVTVINRARGPFSSASVSSSSSHAKLRVEITTAGSYSARTELAEPNVLDIDYRHAPRNVVPAGTTPTAYCSQLSSGFAMLGGGGLTGYDAHGVGRASCLLTTHTPFADDVTFAGSFGATLPADFFPPGATPPAR